VGNTQPPHFDMAGHNARVYGNRDVARTYDHATLRPAEVMLLLRYQSAFLGRSVLDLGVGAGRTAHYLTKCAERYVGIDLSDAMLTLCRRRFPGARLLKGDIRDLTILDGERFDFILASYTILDELSHVERVGVLRDLRGRLSPDGILAFSSHNRAWDSYSGTPTLQRSRNPITQARLLSEHVIAVRNHRRMRPLQETNDTYELRNDISHSWRALHYYIDRRAQEAQLNDLGLELRLVLTLSGESLDAGDMGTFSSELYYVCALAGEPRS
jgi:SAM-dependent methyltransferase